MNRHWECLVRDKTVKCQLFAVFFNRPTDTIIMQYLWRSTQTDGYLLQNHLWQWHNIDIWCNFTATWTYVINHVSLTALMGLHVLLQHYWNCLLPYTLCWMVKLLVWPTSYAFITTWTLKNTHFSTPCPSLLGHHVYWRSSLGYALIMSTIGW